MKRARTFIEWAYGCYAWLLFLFTMLLASSLILLLHRTPRTRPVARYAARAMFRLAGVPLSAQGLARLPATPHIVLVNHTSFLDPIALVALLPARPGYAFVARQQYAIQGLLCPLLMALGIVVLRSEEHSPHRHPNVTLLKSSLRRGNNLVIFPEGRIVPNEGLGRFHSGAFIAAAAEQVPVVIAGLHGARDALRLGTWLPRRHAIELKIGDVLTPAGTDEESLSQLSDAAHKAMLPLTGERDTEV